MPVVSMKQICRKLFFIPFLLQTRGYRHYHQEDCLLEENHNTTQTRTRKTLSITAQHKKKKKQTVAAPTCII